MKEILDIVVLGGFVFILFIFLRGMNETQVQKHLQRLDDQEKQTKKTHSDTEDNNK